MVVAAFCERQNALAKKCSGQICASRPYETALDSELFVAVSLDDFDIKIFLTHPCQQENF